MLLHLFAYPAHLLLAHGYLALFIWSILEGEIGLMLAGWLASMHQLFSYEKVVLVAICGAFLGDLFTFSFGRLFEKKALSYLNAHPNKKKMVDRWIKNWGAAVIVFERFIYGTHIPVLLSFGMSGYPFLKFIFFDIIGIILWAFTFVSIGYFFGQSAINIILLIQKNILVVLFFILLFLFILRTQKGET
ncbi:MULTISPECIES: DedA family protein [unclassified Nitratiruptor]|uniref:DedA family protein n=1 Tax=unclassified Nitratiruptor TaxID=2624044 RepID=UPI001915CD5C|nr:MULTISPECIES: VTT domain-containing protein [unclassified Nitratiruptor]BCD61010.1 lipoprotein B [Nitratiruptor sp. YY08-10]BCD64942.1 lipoprotein B [Nitratiruptor sp. YY08-14]